MNLRYTDEMRKAVKRHAGASGLNELSTDLMNDLAIDLYAKCILLGWQGLEENGQPVTYSQENAKRLMTKYPDFFKIVQSQARDVELFRLSRREESAGN